MPTRARTKSNAMTMAAMEFLEITSNREHPCEPIDQEEYADELAKTSTKNKLSSLQTLGDVFKTFDYNHDDVIDRSEQVRMYHTINKSMEHTLGELVAGARYDEAVDLRDRMTRLRRDFESLQKESISNKNKVENNNMVGAGEKIVKNKTKLWTQRMRQLDGQIAHNKKDLAEIHVMQKDILERELAAKTDPRFKPSKGLLDMKMAERWLCVDKRFEEAKEVRRRADLLEGKERAAHQKACFDADNFQRNTLAADHGSEAEKRGIACSNRWWSSKRQGQLDVRTTKQRITNNTEDMTHMHKMEAHEKPEFGFKPSVAKRKHFAQTSAVNRGTQMKQLVAEGRAAVANLTSTHNFDSTEAAVETVY